MDGTFIANRFDVNHGKGSSTAAGHLREVTEEDIREEEITQGERSRMRGANQNANQRLTNNNMKKINRGELEELESFDQKIKTYISHNKGASWELIRPPESDMRGKPTNCFTEDGCSLHL